MTHSDVPPIVLSVDNVQRLIGRAPYHQWLALRVLRVDEQGIDLEAHWREEWIVNVDRRYTHGGVLAALVDLAGDWALFCRTGRGVPTIDMRVDYHRVAGPGNLTAQGRIVKYGRRFSVAEAKVFDERGELVASGRGTYLTASSQED